MIDVGNGQPCENKLDPLRLFSSTSFKDNPFARAVILIVLSVTVFILLIAGTATTAISYPPKPPRWALQKIEGGGELNEETVTVYTSLDGDYKLIGPLLLMAGIFLFIVVVVLCTVVTREVYYTSRNIRPSLDVTNNSVSVLGGPFFLAVPNPNPGNHQDLTSFAYSRQLWAMPNAPTPDFSIDGGGLKGSRLRPSTAGLEKCSQPPFNPHVDPSKINGKA